MNFDLIPEYYLWQADHLLLHLLLEVVCNHSLLCLFIFSLQIMTMYVTLGHMPACCNYIAIILMIERIHPPSCVALSLHDAVIVFSLRIHPGWVSASFTRCSYVLLVCNRDKGQEDAQDRMLMPSNCQPSHGTE